MWSEDSHLVPVAYLDMVPIRTIGDAGLDVFVNGQRRNSWQSQSQVYLHFLDESDGAVITVDIRKRDTGLSIIGCPQTFRRGGWAGSVSNIEGRFIHGFARDEIHLQSDVCVVAYSDEGVVAFATAKSDEAGAFLMVLPTDVNNSVKNATLRIGIVGSDYCLDGGIIDMTSRPRENIGLLTRVAANPLRVAIKISTPNLRVAHEWGDFHFANSLKASFEKVGIAASVDTNDVWYDSSRDADVVLVLRGRHRVIVDPDKINLLWLISHPDRVEPNEYEDYDHVFVASDIYAKTLSENGITSVSVLHQATDIRIFQPFETLKRKRDCLFVGNSRREYRRMVHWCIEKNIPLSLYGGGWKDVVSPDLVRAENIPNAELAQHYAQHLVLLNDHWDTMRDEGFLSNRLFDGSAVGTPIITDAVRGLSEIFGDTIGIVNSPEELQTVVASCLENPKPFLEKAAMARRNVLQHHTFDHRAEEIRDFIELNAKFHQRLRKLKAT